MQEKTNGSHTRRRAAWPTEEMELMDSGSSARCIMGLESLAANSCDLGPAGEGGREGESSNFKLMWRVWVTLRKRSNDGKRETSAG